MHSFFPSIRFGVNLGWWLQGGCAADPVCQAALQPLCAAGLSARCIHLRAHFAAAVRGVAARVTGLQRLQHPGCLIMVGPSAQVLRIFDCVALQTAVDTSAHFCRLCGAPGHADAGSCSAAARAITPSRSQATWPAPFSLSCCWSLHASSTRWHCRRSQPSCSRRRHR